MAQRTAITGSELIPAIQNDQVVFLTRPQVATFMSITNAATPSRPYALPTGFNGMERFQVIQGDQSVTFSAADLMAYLAGTSQPAPVAYGFRAGPITGAERIIGIQDASTIAFSPAEVATVQGGYVPPPTPLFTTQPSVSPASALSGSTFTATPGTVSNGSVTSRAWLLNGTSISTALTAIPSTAGTLTYQEFATGAVGSVSSTVQSVMVSAASSAVLNALTTTSGLAQAMSTTSLTPFASGTPTGTQITIDPTTTYQAFFGVGDHLTDSSAYVLNTYLTTANRDAHLQQKYGTDGFSIVGLGIGATDFTSRGTYTYDETAGDTALTNFSIGNDTVNIIPIAQKILAINPNVRFIARPWTPPTWMKTGQPDSTKPFVGGTFNATAQNMTTYAQYFVKFIQAYAGYGIPIYAVSVQNEPTNTTNTPSCGWATADMVNFVQNYLAPAFSAANITTKIWVGEDSWNVSTGAGVNVSMLGSAAAPYIDGYAWHGYGGAATTMTTTRNSYPAKGVHFTEHRTLLSQNADASMAQVSGLDIVSVLRNWSQDVIFWNMALDQNGSPSGVTTGRRGTVTVNNSTGAITYNTEYYAMASLGRYIQRGAVRINSTSPAVGSSGTDIETVAFKNPDGSIAVFIWNGSSSAISTSLVDATTSKFTNYSIPGRAILMVQYSGLSGGTAEPLAITGTPAPNAMVGTAYSFVPTKTGGSGTPTYALTGTLPAGLTFSTSTGSISGTPTATGTATGLSISVTDSSGTASLAAFSIQSYPAMAIASPPPATGTVGTAYSYTPAVSGGSGTYSGFAFNGTVPAGLSFSATTGAITGTPTAASTTPNASITVTDSAGNVYTTGFFSITIAAAGGGTTPVSTDTFASSYPATASASPNTTSWSHTIAANANLVVVAIAAGTPYKSGSDLTYTSTVTIGGVSATKLTAVSSGGSVGGHDRTVELWALSNPPTGAQTVVATITSAASGASTSNIAGISRSYINATGIGTAASIANSSGSATSSSVTTSGGSVNGLVFAVSAARSTVVPAPGTGQTSVSSGISGTNMAANTTEKADGGGSVVSSFTIGTADQFATAAVPILSA